LGFRALVAPDQRRPDDFVVLVHKDGAMHLARKANGGDGFGRQTRTLNSLANRNRCGAPPVTRVLLRPSRLRTGEIRVLFRARGENRAVFVQNDGAGSARSDIDTKDGNTASFRRTTYARCPPEREFRRRFGEESTNTRVPRKAALLCSVNVHGGHLRPAVRACQRSEQEIVSSLAARLTSRGLEHTMPASKFLKLAMAVQ
jgi:hypothetical protein